MLFSKIGYYTTATVTPCNLTLCVHLIHKIPLRHYLHTFSLITFTYSQRKTRLLFPFSCYIVPFPVSLISLYCQDERGHLFCFTTYIVYVLMQQLAFICMLSCAIIANKGTDYRFIPF